MHKQIPKDNWKIFEKQLKNKILWLVAEDPNLLQKYLFIYKGYVPRHPVVAYNHT